MANSRAEVLGEALRALQLGRRLRGPEHLDAGRGQIVGEARHQRRFGPDHDQADIAFSLQKRTTAA